MLNMNTSHLIILLIRFFAICLVVFSINNAVYSGILYSEFNGLLFTSLAIPVSIIIAGVLIWFMPYTLARSLTGFRGKFDADSEPISFAEFSSITFLTLSLYLAYNVVSDASYWLYYCLNYEKYGLTEIGLEPSASIFATMLEFLLLVMMVLGRKKIFFYFKKIRS